MSASDDPSVGLGDGTRLVVRSGNPTADDIEALVAALDTAQRADAAAAPLRRPAWLRAARIESVGGRPVASPGDL